MLWCSVSLNCEFEKRYTEALIHFHIQFQTPAFLHRQSHLRPLHANRTIATKGNGLFCYPRSNTQAKKHERTCPGSRQWESRKWKLETSDENHDLETHPQAKSGGDGLSRTKRLREEVRRFLEERGRANTVEVFDHLNERFSWGATMNQVGNILAKDTRFEKVGSVRDFFRGARYSVCIWALSGRGHSDSGPSKATA